MGTGDRINCQYFEKQGAFFVLIVTGGAEEKINQPTSMCGEQCVLIGEPGSGDYSKRQCMAINIMGEPQDVLN